MTGGPVSLRAFRSTFAMDRNPAGLGTVRWGVTRARSGRCSLPVLDPEELFVEGVVVDLGAGWDQGRRGGEEGLQGAPVGDQPRGGCLRAELDDDACGHAYPS